MMTIFLVGFMGCGKSTLGKKLAKNLDFNFIDLDDFIEDCEARTIQEIFEINGESYFRKLERFYLLKLIKNKNTVIAVGGGTPCFFDNISQMNKNGLTIYINMPTKALVNRLKSSNKFRPLIEGMKEIELKDYINKTIKEREVFYDKSHKIVNGINLSVKQLQKYCFD